MDEVEHRWLKLPKAKINNDTENCRILNVNDRIVELSDISPAILADYLEIARPLIDSELYQARALKRFTDASPLATTILIGRLATIRSEFDVFTIAAQKRTQSTLFGLDDISDEYKEYWKRVDRALYVPEVHRSILSDNDQLRGTWLGLRRP